MGELVHILLISGSLRAGSTNSAVLRTALAVADEAGTTAEAYEGLGRLPHFNPDDDPVGGPVDPAVGELREAIGAANALLFSTPEYAGALPGSFKNLLDWTVGGGETYGMPAGWINSAGPAAPAGGEGAHGELRRVLGYTGTEIVEEAAARVPVTRGDVGDDGLIAVEGIRAGITDALVALRTRVLAGRD